MGFLSDSGPEIEQISFGDIRDQAIQSQIRNLPDIVRAFEEFGPEIGSARLASFAAANPDVARNVVSLGGLLGDRIQQLRTGRIPDFLRLPFLENLRSAQAARGQALSPISAASEAGQLGELTENVARGTINQALGFSRLRQGGEVGLGDLGLDSGSISAATEQGIEIADFNQAAKQLNFRRDQERRKRIAQLTGFAVGGLIPGAGGFGELTGSEIGSQVGTLLF